MTSENVTHKEGEMKIGGRRDEDRRKGDIERQKDGDRNKQEKK
jgi:hypothetical protein